MYHFIADSSAEPLRLSNRFQVSGQICQYLKPFQLEALRFLHKHYEKRDSCVLNDESGLGKCATICVFLGAILENSNNKCLIVVQNDEDIVGWKFHLNILARHLTFQDITQDSDCSSLNQNLYIAKWNTLKSLGDLSRFDFNYIIIDNRGQIVNNNFCVGMLLKFYEKKVDIFVSSVDITSDLKLFYNTLRLCGRLENQYSSWKTFEEKFKLPDAKEVSTKSVSLEEYFLKREILIDYCKDFRLRRYRHQQEKCLPLVEPMLYKNNIETWRTVFNSQNNSSSMSSESVQEILNTTAERNTEELFEQYIQSKKKNDISGNTALKEQTQLVSEDECFEVVETPVIMSPLLFVSDSDDESEGEAQCTDSIIEVINIEDTDDKLLSRSKLDAIKSEKLAKLNTYDVETTKNNSKNISAAKSDFPDTERNKTRKLRNPVKFIPEERNKRVTRRNYHTNERKLRNSRISVLGDSTEKRSKIKHKANNQEKIQTTAQTVKDNDISENKPRTRSTNFSVTPDRKRQNENKSEVSPKKNAKRDSKGTQNQGNEMIKPSVDRHRSEQKAEAEKDQLNQEIKKNTADDSREMVKNQKNALSTNQKGKIQTRNSKEVSKVETTNKNAFNKNVLSSTPTKKSRVTDKSEKQEASMSLREDNQIGKKSSKTNSKNKEALEKVSDLHANNNAKYHSEDFRNDINTRAVNSTPRNKMSTSSSSRKDCKTQPSAGRRILAIAPVGVHTHQTRGMKRATRSLTSNKSKYMMLADWSLDIDKKVSRNKRKSKVNSEKSDSASASTVKIKKVDDDKKSFIRKTQSAQKSNNTVEIILQNNTSHKSSQASVLPMSECEEIQCGQKLTPNSNASSERNSNIFQKSFNFLVPSTPPSLRTLENPSFPFNSTNIPDSELAVVPSTSANADVILLSSSQDEGSVSSVSSLSRRTRVLKRKEMRNKPMDKNIPCVSIPKAAFSELLAQQNLRRAAKSPDLFSNCSDVGITCSQLNNKAFEGFKIFGSEVKQFQQQHARSATVSASSSRDRSCLDLLEKMFEPRQKKKETPQKVTQKNKRPSKRDNIMPALPTEPITHDDDEKNKKNKTSTTKPNPIVEDAVFEITNNGIFGSTIRINSNGEASPVQNQQQVLKTIQHNKITNYLIGSTQQAGAISLTVENDVQMQRTPKKSAQLSGTAYNINGSGSGNGNPVTSAHRKSPKSKQSTQNTKLTKWFSKNSGGKLSPKELTNEKKDINSTRKSPIKRRRLELSFNN